MQETELKQLLKTLQHNLDILREREAKFGGNAPLDLLNQIEDHETALVLVKTRLAGDISDEALEKELAPLTLTIERGGTEIIAGDKVAGDKSVIKIGTLVIPTIPLLALLLLVIGILVFVGLNFLGPTKMSGRFNVAVADFGELNSAGQLQRSTVGQRLSTWVFEELEAQNNQYPANNQVQVWHDSLPLTRKLTKIGLIEGSTPQARADAAAKLAQKIGADVVIYGYLDAGEAKVFTLEFYVSPRLQGETDTTIGRYQLGEPIPVPVNFDPADVLSREAVAGPLTTRTDALFWLILGLKEELLGRSKEALDIFQQAEQQLPDWQEKGEGKETLYFFIGRSALFLNRDEEAEQVFSKALQIQPEFVRAQIALGSVYYKRAQCLLQNTARQNNETCIELCQNDQGCIAPCQQSPEECLQQVNTDLEQTISDYQRGLDLAQGSQNPQLETIARFALSTAYFLEGQTYYYLRQDAEANRFLESAIQEIQQVLAVLVKAEQYRFVGQAYLALGSAYTLQARMLQDQGKTNESIALYGKAGEAYKQCIAQQQLMPYSDQILIEQVIANCKSSDELTKQALLSLQGG
jgi:tetratricopeptide (TPR) repeat protein